MWNETLGEYESERGSRPTLAERIAAGQLSAQEIAEMAHESALQILTSASRSRAELAARLGRMGYPEDAIDPLLDRLTEVGLLDDARYAEALVRTRHTERGRTRRVIAQELRRRGIDDEIAAGALEQVSDEDEDESARELARARLARTTGLPRDVRIRRVVGVLSRKGYAPGRAYRIVSEEIAAQAQENE